MRTWAYAHASASYGLAADSAAAIDLLEPLMSDMGAELSDRTPDWTVAGSEGSWQLLSTGGETVERHKHSGDLLYALFDKLVFQIADNHQEGHCLHAAAVCRGDRALLLPAASGRGKSSLCAWMVSQGFRYLSDELVVIGQGGEVIGVGRPIQLKPGSLDAVDSLLRPGEAIIPGARASSASARALGGRVHVGPPPKVAAWLFPHYGEGEVFQLETLKGTDIAMSALATHVNARNLPGHGFREFVNLVRSTQGCRLRYGGFDTLPTDFTSQLEGLIGTLD